MNKDLCCPVLLTEVLVVHICFFMRYISREIISAAFLGLHVYVAALRLAWGLDVRIQELRKRSAGDSYRMLQGLTSTPCVVQFSVYKSAGFVHLGAFLASSRCLGLQESAEAYQAVSSADKGSVLIAQSLSIGSIVLPFCVLYLGSYKVLPKSNYYGAYMGILSPHHGGHEVAKRVDPWQRSGTLHAASLLSATQDYGQNRRLWV